MIKGLLAVLVVFGLSALFISAYLSPDDLARCQEEPSTSTGCEKADAIIAVSGGKTQIRTAEAIDLYKRGWADTLIFSGAALDIDAPSNAAVMRKQALAAGVPVNDIFIEEFSKTTLENAEKTSKLAEGKNINRMILVTSPYHQRRASTEFKDLTDNKIQILNHPTRNDPDWPWYWWATPKGWWLAGGELVKIIVSTAGESR
jgi:uncharacterized SAM-binding protein YcdF (DUF218 family)